MMKGQQDEDLIKYKVPEEIFEQIHLDYLEKYKKTMLFEPNILKSIYEELQKNEIYLTSFISQGNFGAVFEALYKQELVAIKCMQVDLDKIQEEEKIINLLNGTPYVFKHIHQLYSSDKTKYYQISKKYQCSLQDIMVDLFSKKKTLPLNQIIGFSLQMSSVFEKMQANNMLHSDFKPDNILYDSLEKSFNICDFGVSKFFNGQKSKTYYLKGFTRKYSAPEAQYEEPDNNFFNIKYDIYGLGIILLEMTLGRFLNDEECKSIMNGQLSQFLSKNELYSDLNGIIIQMLQFKSNNRVDSFKLTELLNILKLQIEDQFCQMIKGKLDFFDSIQMNSKFKQSFDQFKYDCKLKYTRLDSYSFKGKEELNQFQECIDKRLVCYLDLNFAKNEFNSEEAKNIGMNLEKCQNLTSLNLDLKQNELGADGAKNIGMSLEKCQNIAYLNLNLGGNSLGADGAKNIGMSLEKCQNLTSLNLYLKKNELRADGAKNIGMSLEKCQNITSLNLDLEGNSLGADGGKNIGISLEKCQNITFLNLNLWQFNKILI